MHALGMTVLKSRKGLSGLLPSSSVWLESYHEFSSSIDLAVMKPNAHVRKNAIKTISCDDLFDFWGSKAAMVELQKHEKMQPKQRI